MITAYDYDVIHQACTRKCSFFVIIFFEYIFLLQKSQYVTISFQMSHSKGLYDIPKLIYLERKRKKDAVDAEYRSSSKLSCFQAHGFSPLFKTRSCKFLHRVSDNTILIDCNTLFFNLALFLGVLGYCISYYGT